MTNREPKISQEQYDEMKSELDERIEELEEERDNYEEKASNGEECVEEERELLEKFYGFKVPGAFNPSGLKEEIERRRKHRWNEEFGVLDYLVPILDRMIEREEAITDEDLPF